MSALDAAVTSNKALYLGICSYTTEPSRSRLSV